MRGVLAATLALAMLAPVPSQALPPGPPEVQILTRQLEDPFTFEITMRARDPDGMLVRLELCVEDECWLQTHTSPGGAFEDLTFCLSGDADELTIEHTFPGPGDYLLRASATGRGCPVVGAEETTVIDRIHSILEPPPPHEPIPCAHPGTPTATAPGVDDETVTIAASLAQTGPLASFQADAAIGMLAAVKVINDLGGVCSRSLDLVLTDDGGDQERRHALMRDQVESGDVFAFVAQESAEAVRSGMLDDAEMPSIGSLAEDLVEFTSPWVWPVTGGNDTFGWITVTEAYEQGARRFALVYDRSSWGSQTRDAVEEAVASYEDAELVDPVGILPGQASYGAEIQRFNVACQSGCDAVIYALTPGTLATWLAGRPQRGVIRESLHPMLFATRTSASCRDCMGMVSWNDIHPPVGRHPGEVTRYCNDVERISPTVDCANRHVQNAYAAVFLAARAMGLVGVDLTRGDLATVLETTSFDLGMHGGSLSWTAPRRQANRWMRGYEIVVSSGAFAGYRDLRAWHEDPRP